MLTIALPAPGSAARNRLLSVDTLRRRALERLYERREAVDQLIRSLERYQQVDGINRADCVPFNVAEK